MKSIKEFLGYLAFGVSQYRGFLIKESHVELIGFRVKYKIPKDQDLTVKELFDSLEKVILSSDQDKLEGEDWLRQIQTIKSKIS